MAQVLIFLAGFFISFIAGYQTAMRTKKNNGADIYKKYKKTSGLYEGVKRK